MYRISHYIAVLLLLLFARVMVPDALILELHAHTHTVHTDHTDTHDAQVGKKHKHCPVEDLFDSPFQGPATQVALAPARQHVVYISCYQQRDLFTSNRLFRLRGPPLV